MLKLLISNTVRYGILPFLTLLLISASCSSGRYTTVSDASVTSLSGKSSVTEGSLVYALPLSVLDIELVAERVIEKPGPYSRFASDLLGLKDVIRDENESWTIKSLRISTHQELDPSEFYVIDAKGVFSSNILSLKREGLILDLNPEIYNSGNTLYKESGTDLNRLRVFDLGADEYFQDRKDTMYKVVSVDTAFIKVPYMVEKKQNFTVEQLAEKAANRLLEIRDGKHLILTGETNVFPQNEAAINEMNRLETEYTELFTGKTIKDNHIFNYQIIPGKEMTGKKIQICTFSNETGPEPTGMKSGIPFVMELIPEMKTRDLKLNYLVSKEAASQKATHLFYRVPDVVNIRVSLGDDFIGTSRKLIYQFGEVVRLPANYVFGR